MPLFAIIGHDIADSSRLRQAARPAHLDRLKKLEAEGRLIIAGPTPTDHEKAVMTGSVIIADFDSLSAAQSWVDDDPYFTTGVYSHVDIKPFIQALPQALTS